MLSFISEEIHRNFQSICETLIVSLNKYFKLVVLWQGK